MLSGKVCIGDPSADSAVARFDADMAIIERLAAGDLDFLCTIINADSPAELLRRVYRVAAATANPGLALGRLLAGPKEDFATFCLNLSGYRRFIDRVATGRQSPRIIAEEIEQEDRFWLIEMLHTRFGGPPVEAMIELIRASERWTLPADELLPELVRVSIYMAEHHASGAVSEEAVDRAISHLWDLSIKQEADGNGVVSEAIEDEPTGRKVGRARGEAGEREDGQSSPANGTASGEGQNDDDDDPAEGA